MLKKVSLLFLFLLFTFSLLVYLLWGVPLPNRLNSDVNNPVSTLILDRNGKLIYEIFEEKRRTPIDINNLPLYVVQATIAIEDKDFYKHSGFSVRGIARAFFNTLAKNNLQGGSTITQQLVKTTLLTPERTIKRKIRELVLSLFVELRYSKNEILTMYLNDVPYGGTAWGIEAASHTYFGKKASELTLGEATLLAGLPQAPTRYSPFGVNPELSKIRQQAVLRRMVEDGYITQLEAEEAAGEILAFSKPFDKLRAPHFALWVKEQLVEKYGEGVVERGGLRVTTTLDLDLQDFAQTAVSSEIEKLKGANVKNGATLITISGTGEILAMVGSKGYFAKDEDGNVNVTLRPRQPGSAIKPLNYALAFQEGRITPSTLLADVPSCFLVSGQEAYCPTDYDGNFHGGIQARFALGNSYNIPAVRVLALNTVAEFVGFAKKMGLSLREASDYGLSLTLGGGEVRMTDMAVAFGVFANGGVKQDLVSVLEIKDWKGNNLFRYEPKEGERVLGEDVSFLITHILSDNNARLSAFGESSFLNVKGHSEVSVKTGTTNDKRDNWTIGYNPEVVVATWVGNNDNTPMSAVASGITGASPIWNKITKEALDRIEAGRLGPWGAELKIHDHEFVQKPQGVVGADVCSDSGLLVTEGVSCPARFEYFLQDFFPEAARNLTRQVNVFKDTGMLASPDVTSDQIEVKDKQVIDDPLGTPYCLDCPIQLWKINVDVGG